MNDNEIYERLESSFDDKIKLDFDDVKKRIANLDSKETAVITPFAPPAKKRRNVFAVVAAAAACLVCFIGLSVVLSQSSTAEKDSAMYESAYYSEEESVLTAEYSCFVYDDAEAIQDFNDSFGAINSAAGIVEEGDNEAFDEECIIESEEQCVSESEIISDSDISDSDVN